MAFGLNELLKVSIPIVIVSVVLLNYTPLFENLIPRNSIPIKNSIPNTQPVQQTLNTYINLSYSIVEYLDKTCNSPAAIFASDEGKFINDNFKLIKVIVIFRHGDRGPLRPVAGKSKIDCRLSRLPYDEDKVDKFLNYVQTFYRSVLDRSYKDIIDNREFYDFPNSSMCRSGMLTKVGVAQLIKLGEQLSEVYCKRLNINENTLSRKIRINVTPYPRTFQSALSFLFGFALSMNIDLSLDSPKFIFGKEHGYFCGLDRNLDEDYCHQKCHSKYEKFKNETTLSKLFHHKEVEKINVLRRKLRKYFIEEKEQERYYTNNRHILDAVNTYYCHGKTLPPSFTNDDAENLIENVKNIIKVTRSNENYKQSSLIVMYALISEILRSIQNEDSNFEIFSGHDITLEAFNAILNFYNEHSIPPYGSRLIMEIYKINDEKYFKFIYNGNDVTSSLTTAIYDNHVIKAHIPPISTEESHYDLIKVSKIEKYFLQLYKYYFNSINFGSICYEDIFVDNKVLDYLGKHKPGKKNNEVEPDLNDDLESR